MLKKVLMILLCAVLMVMTAACASGETAFRGWNKTDKYQYVIFGNYPTDKDGTVQPVKWYVLSVTEDGYALILSNQVIDAYPIEYIEGKINLKEYKDYRKISTIEESDLFAWMNSEMVDTLFTPEEQAALDDSRGKLFLLSREEYLVTDYGFSKAVYGENIKSRICSATGYALKRGVYQQAKGASYWVGTVRDPKGTQVQIVGYDGHMSWAGYGRKNVGVRPCIRLKVDQVSFSSGSGTKDDPYIITLN